MTHIVFFEKPGCAGNARQRKVLLASGHTLEPRDLLGTRWTREALLAFLAPLPVAQWFNRAAVRIKSGEVQPEALDAETALALLLSEPLLIRRPLMQRADDQSRHVGFDTAAVDAWVGLGTKPASSSLEACASPAQSCTSPGEQHANV